jgi:hypothetical protein
MSSKQLVPNIILQPPLPQSLKQKEHAESYILYSKKNESDHIIQFSKLSISKTKSNT